MGKIKTLAELEKICRQVEKEGKKIGLITGCFDILHIGHVELFRFAKKSADVVIVGLENDKTIRLSKGKSRPIHDSEQRTNVLSELSSIDYVFVIKDVFDFGSKEAERIHGRILAALRPTYLITNPKADKFWREKQTRAREVGAMLLKDNSKKITGATQIIQKLEAEF